MNLITISASTLIQQSDFLIEGHYIKKRIAVNTVPNKLSLAKLSVLESTDVIIFQSKNAVRHLDYSLSESDAEIFCVGPYTSHFLKSKFSGIRIKIFENKLSQKTSQLKISIKYQKFS